MSYYCTYFDYRYTVRGLTLYQSLKQYSSPFILWVLCLDDFTYNSLSNLKLEGLRLVQLAELEIAEPKLLIARQNRSLVEYYFTLSPIWPLYLLNHHAEIDIITYLDADLWFFSSPNLLYAELGQENSVLIIPHRFPPKLRHMEKFGIYNVGLQMFRNDAIGHACLEWWRECCLEWCYDILEDNRYADQKYLDDWPQRFAGVVVSRQKGANLAPWNWLNYQISRKNGQLWVDEQPVIFYHYQGLKVLNRWLYDSWVTVYAPMPRRVLWLLYRPYIRALSETTKRWQPAMPGLEIGAVSARKLNYTWRTLLKHLLFGGIDFIV